jgi:DNA mismatch endonuclease (patch repair protein)
LLPRHHAAIFVHGCFWHQHAGCKHAKVPLQREAYWLSKLTRTQQRDRNAIAALSKEGWRVLVVWECSTANKESLARELTSFLEQASEEQLVKVSVPG